MEERKNINELMALYSLEDTVKDIYVEGEKDKNFISWFIDSRGVKNISVYEIGDINISDEILDKYDLPRGSNRSRVIAAAMELSEELPGCRNVMFIADRDYEDYLPTMVNSKLLVFTDYNSLESYLLNENAIRKIIAIVYGAYTERTTNFY